jgi:NAD(P)-dependent dehydrogenase (short-subunit alcohol dehydrogenase family)
MTTSEKIAHDHLLLIGAGPGVGAAIVRRFGRAGFRATLIAQDAEKLEQLAEELRDEGSASTQSSPTSPTSALTGPSWRRSMGQRVLPASSSTTPR